MVSTWFQFHIEFSINFSMMPDAWYKFMLKCNYCSQSPCQLQLNHTCKDDSLAVGPFGVEASGEICRQDKGHHYRIWYQCIYIWWPIYLSQSYMTIDFTPSACYQGRPQLGTPTALLKFSLLFWASKSWISLAVRVNVNHIESFANCRYLSLGTQ